jgi:mRNA-degrading endonuclease RelE of RelBE toxin-antitoxin system
LPGIRILYEVDEDAATVYVINVAVTGTKTAQYPRRSVR